MSRNFDFAEGEFYHIYNRGTERRAIFSSDDDYVRFMALLYLSNSKSSFNIADILKRGDKVYQDLFTEDISGDLVEIGAYCLMPNHFHLLVRENQEGGVSTFMKKVSNSYTMYFNKKYRRNGALFQGRFKAKHVEDDNYLHYLFAYIHLNPVKLIDPDWKEEGVKDKEGVRSYLNSFQYSSYYEYIEKERPEKSIVNTDDFPEYFQTSKEFTDFLGDWLLYHEMS